MRVAIYSAKAIKVMDKIPANQKRLIADKIEQLVEDPDSLKNNIVKMQGECCYRLRVGKWRIKFDDDGFIIDIIEIMPRGKNYKP